MKERGLKNNKMSILAYSKRYVKNRDPSKIERMKCSNNLKFEWVGVDHPSWQNKFKKMEARHQHSEFVDEPVNLSLTEFKNQA
jgi:hypothetical protein